MNRRVDGAPGPVRTCVGCRTRAEAAELLRVVAVPDPTDPSVVPDPRRRAHGRGAWVHPDLTCVETAVRRRAFARALRVPGVVDAAPVVAYLAAGDPTATTSTTGSTTRPHHRGHPQEMTSDELSMKRQR